MKQDKQQLINALLSHYQNRVEILSNKKAEFLKKLLKQSDDFKIAKLRKEIGKSKI